MDFQDIIQNLSSKDCLEQTNAIQQIKKYITESCNNEKIATNEYFFINILPNLLELGSDKNHQSEIEELCEDTYEIDVLLGLV